MDDRQTEEIARIEHELARLRSTYGLMERRARMLKVCCQFVFVPIVIAMFVYLLVIDFVAGLFAIVFSSAIGSLGSTVANTPADGLILQCRDPKVGGFVRATQRKWKFG